MHFILIKTKNNYSKCFAFFALFIAPIFTLNSIVIVDRGAKIFLAPGRRVYHSYNATELRH